MIAGPLPRRALAHRVPARLVLAVGGSSSTTRTAAALAMRQDWLPLGGNFRHNWHSDGEHRARTVAPVAGNDPPAQGFDKAAADREVKPSAGTSAILRVDAVESVEDAFEIGRRYSRALVDDFDLDELSIAGRPNIDPTAAGRIFCRVIEKIEQHLFEEHGIEAQHRQS